MYVNRHSASNSATFLGLEFGYKNKKKGVKVSEAAARYFRDFFPGTKFKIKVKR